MKPFDVLVGRLTLTGLATAEMLWDINQNTDDPISDATDVAWWGVELALIWNPVLKPAAIGAGLRTALSSVVFSTIIAPVAAGYMIGATVGTAISYAIWGEEGAETALGFYSAGLLPGTDAPDLTDYQYIFKPTKPGGPVSLYDVGEAGLKATILTARKLWNKRVRYSNPNPFMI